MDLKLQHFLTISLHLKLSNRYKRVRMVSMNESHLPDCSGCTSVMVPCRNFWFVVVFVSSLAYESSAKKEEDSKKEVDFELAVAAQHGHHEYHHEEHHPKPHSSHKKHWDHGHGGHQ